MRYQILIPAVAFLGAVGACTDQSTSPTAVTEIMPLLSVEAAQRTEVDGLVHACGSTPPDGIKITPGGTLHIRGAGNWNQWVFGHPLLDGFEEIVGDANINLNTGDGRAHGVRTLRPDAVEGTWEIRNQVRIGMGGWGVGHGTGELHGMTIKVRGEGFHTQGQNVCNPSNPSSRVHVTIIAPAASG